MNSEWSYDTNEFIAAPVCDLTATEDSPVVIQEVQLWGLIYRVWDKAETSWLGKTLKIFKKMAYLSFMVLYSRTLFTFYILHLLHFMSYFRSLLLPWNVKKYAANWLCSLFHWSTRVGENPIILTPLDPYLCHASYLVDPYMQCRSYAS